MAGHLGKTLCRPSTLKMRWRVSLSCRDMGAPNIPFVLIGILPGPKSLLSVSCFLNVAAVVL